MPPLARITLGIALSLALLLAPSAVRADDDPPDDTTLQGEDEQAKTVFDGTDETATTVDVAQAAVSAAAASVSAAAPAPCPARPADQLVFGKLDLPPPVLPGGRKFMNFHASKCAAKTGWPSNVNNETSPGYSSWARPTSRKDDASQIDMLVIHETGGTSGYSNGAGHLVHFLVDRGGNVYQLMDLAKSSHHASNTWLNARSIGIEVANGIGHPSYRNYVTRTIDCPKGHKCADVGGSGSVHLVIPADDQLQSLDALVAYLVGTTRASGPFTVKIPNLWLTTEYTRAGRYEPYALLGVQGPGGAWYHVRENPCSLKAADRSRMEQTLCTRHGGVMTHSVINGVGRGIDGTSGGLYTWLRTRGRNHRAAKDQMVCILETPHVTVGGDKELESWFRPIDYSYADTRLVPILDCMSPGTGPVHAANGSGGQAAPSAVLAIPTADAPAPQAPEEPAPQAPEEPAPQAPEEPAPQAPEEPAPQAPEEPVQGESPSGGDTATGEVTED